MNRENKKRKYDKKYYRTHPCTDAFTCKVCGWPVVSAGAGSSHRNHCPNCLYSIPSGQRAGRPLFPMSWPYGTHRRQGPENGKWAIIHRCRTCGKISSNRSAADDNPMKLMALAMRPFGSPMVSQSDVKSLTHTME